MAGLSVDGFTVEWGADTRQYEMANKRVRDDAKRTAFTVEKEWEGASKKTMKQLLGFSNIAKATFAGVGGAIGVGAKGALEFVKVNEEAGHSLTALQKSIKDLWVSIGADASGTFSILKDGIDLMKDGRDYFVDLFQGAGSAQSLKDAMAERQAQDRNFKAQMDANKRAKDSRKDLLGSIEVGDARYLDAQRELIQNDLNEAAKQAQADLNSGDAKRIKDAREMLDLEQQIANIKWNAALDAEENWWKEGRAKQKAAADAKAQAIEQEQAESERRQRERDEEKERLNALRMDVKEMGEAARLATLRATGRGKEADAAEIQAKYEMDIAKVRDAWGVDLDDKLATIAALQAARGAELADLSRKAMGTDIKGSLAAGSFSGQAFAQAFGGKGADLKTVEKSQLKVLENIEKNTRNQSAVMAP